MNERMKHFDCPPNLCFSRELTTEIITKYLVVPFPEFEYLQSIINSLYKHCRGQREWYKLQLHSKVPVNSREKAYEATEMLPYLAAKTAETDKQSYVFRNFFNGFDSLLSSLINKNCRLFHG